MSHARGAQAAASAKPVRMRPGLALFSSLLLTLTGIAACSSTTVESPVPTNTPQPDPTTTPPTEEPPAPNALADAIDDMIGRAAKKDAFAGSVIVVDGGKQVLAKAYGNANRDAQKANAVDTVFRVGSISKQFTATALLALVADGKVALTDPVSQHFPSYPKENLTKDGVEVTLHHLISHTSGLPDPRSNSAFKSAAWRRAIAPSEQVAWAQTLPLVATPGTAYAYLNYNFLLAALVVEKVSGQSYEGFLKSRFFGPLGMTDSGTVLAGFPASLSDRSATGYYDADGELLAFTDDPSFKDTDVTLAFGSGQVFSTVGDLAKWDRALYGDKILPAAQRDLLFKANLDDYGYGWVIETKKGVTVEWHNGALSPLGFSSFMVRVPSKDRFVVYLSNIDISRVQPLESKIIDYVSR